MRTCVHALLCVACVSIFNDACACILAAGRVVCCVPVANSVAVSASPDVLASLRPVATC